MSRLIPVVALVACAVAAGTTPAAPEPNRAPDDEQERLLARGKKFAERGQIDLFVAVTAAWKLKPGDRRMWEPAADFGRKLIDRADMKEQRRKPQDTPSSYKDFDTYLDNWRPEFKVTNEKYVRADPDAAVPPRKGYEAIQAPSVVDPKVICNCLILSRGSVQAGKAIAHSLIFANGDVKAGTHMQSVVIVCDGDVTVAEEFVNRSVIVARGNITAKVGLSNLALIAGGKIELGNKDIRKGNGRDIIMDNKPINTLGVTFFELSTIGVEVAVVEKSVRVGAVAADKPCAKAGLKIGDVILEVNGKSPSDAESLRRLLRDSLAVGDAKVKVKRGDEELSVKLTLPD